MVLCLGHLSVHKIIGGMTRMCISYQVSGVVVQPKEVGGT